MIRLKNIERMSFKDKGKKVMDKTGYANYSSKDSIFDRMANKENLSIVSIILELGKLPTEKDVRTLSESFELICTEKLSDINIILKDINFHDDVLPFILNKPYNPEGIYNMSDTIYPDHVDDKKYTIAAVYLDEKDCKKLKQLLNPYDYETLFTNLQSRLLMEIIGIYVDQHYRDQFGLKRCQFMKELVSILILKSKGYSLGTWVRPRLEYFYCMSFIDNPAPITKELLDKAYECYKELIKL